MVQDSRSSSSDKDQATEGKVADSEVAGAELHHHSVVIDRSTVTLAAWPSGAWTLSVEGVVADRADGTAEPTLRAALPDGSEVTVRVDHGESGSPRLSFSHAGHQFAVFNL